MRADAPRVAWACEADLAIEVGGTRLVVTGHGGDLEVAFADRRSAKRFVRRTRLAGRSSRARLSRLAAHLDRVGLRLGVTAGGRRIATIGRGVRPNLVAKALGLAHGSIPAASLLLR